MSVYKLDREGNITRFFERTGGIGTVLYISGGKKHATVFMPRWFYCVALLVFLGSGLLGGRLLP